MQTALALHHSSCFSIIKVYKVHVRRFRLFLFPEAFLRVLRALHFYGMETRCRSALYGTMRKPRTSLTCFCVEAPIFAGRIGFFVSACAFEEDEALASWLPDPWILGRPLWREAQGKIPLAGGTTH